MVTDADPVSGTRASTTLSTFSLKLGGPFDFCAFASLAPSSARLSGNRFEVYSSSSAFLVYVGRDFMSEGGMCQEGDEISIIELIRAVGQTVITYNIWRNSLILSNAE
jgi:hypothetical protein